VAQSGGYCGGGSGAGCAVELCFYNHRRVSPCIYSAPFFLETTFGNPPIYAR